MKKDVRLYNALFPIWMFWFIPFAWWYVVPGNFIIDSLVLIIAMHVMKIEGKKKFYLSNIFKAFIFGFLADIIGGISIFLNISEFDPTNGLYYNFWASVVGVIIAGVMIFIFDYFISFRKCEYRYRFKLAMTFAIATAPYTFLIPSDWLYGGR